MASWGGLNKALTAWRNAIERRLGAIRGRASDGARADAAHGSTSQHQEDGDGTVDAFDMDVNVLGSKTSTGTPAELRIVEAMKLDFEQDPHKRGQLWIHAREIANKDRDDWRERDYTGKSPHTEHGHWESDQDREDIGAEWPMPNTDRVLRELGVGNPNPAPVGESEAQGVSRQDVADWAHGIAQSVRNEYDEGVSAREKAAFKVWREDAAAIVRFGLGLNFDQQTAANLPPGQFARLGAALAGLDVVDEQKVADLMLPAIKAAIAEAGDDADEAAFEAALRRVLGSLASSAELRSATVNGPYG